MTGVLTFMSFMLLLYAGILIRRRETRRAWLAFAQTHKLSTLERDGGGIEVRGSYKGFYINAGFERRRRMLQNNREYYWTFIQVQVPHDVQGDFLLKPESLGAKAVKMIGGEDIQIGDQAFDKAFIIQADYPGQIQDFLAPARVRQALLTLRTKHSNMRMDQHDLSMEKSITLSFARTIAILNDFIQCARAIKGAHQTQALPPSSPW